MTPYVCYDIWARLQRSRLYLRAGLIQRHERGAHHLHPKTCLIFRYCQIWKKRAEPALTPGDFTSLAFNSIPITQADTYDVFPDDALSIEMDLA